LVMGFGGGLEGGEEREGEGGAAGPHEREHITAGEI
jgi:hypothetical protein